MNAEQRERLAKLMEEVEAIEQVEREKYDNMPEGLQSSASGCAIETGADHLSEAVESLRCAIEESAQ